MEHEVNGLVLLALGLLLDVLLVLLEELGSELDVTGFLDRNQQMSAREVNNGASTHVNSVDVSESSSDAEVGGNGRKRLVDVVDVLGLGVEGVVVNWNPLVRI